MTEPHANSKSCPLSRPVESLWGVGSERGVQFTRLGIHTIGDLLLHRPRRYEDRRHFRPIAEMSTAEAAIARGNVMAQGTKRYRGGRKSVFELILDDGSAHLHCRWWNLPYMENYFEVGNEVLVYGKLTGMKPRTMDHPETEVVDEGEENTIHMGRIVPVYPLTEGLPQRWLRTLISRTLEQHEKDIIEPWTTRARRSIPAARHAGGKDRHAGDSVPDSLPSRAVAVRMLHAPETLDDADRARQRLALDEFVALQIEIQQRRKRFEASARALPCRGNNACVRPFLKGLEYTLTDAQTRVLREIREDMGAKHPMRRLLQGDVGSGKTVVAACTALMAIESGFSVALMAPTEILAEQHYQNFTQWFEPLHIPVELRTGSRKSDEGQETGNERQPASGRTALFVGTHALLTTGFDLPNLGLVIVDEQQKFGVAQREQLVRKGRYPHLLVMTATPIPRTLGLTVYGDLDLSVIDEPPTGRGRVRTFLRETGNLPKVWEFVRGKLDEGQQAYVVYPRVEDTAGGTTKAVLKEFERIQKALTPHCVAVLHGRLRADEKQRVMDAFRGGDVRVLVATSLIEVGLDVASATIMVIEDAGNFGLAQLHQLRGRIGRGAEESFCILVSDAKDLESRERLKMLESCLDGFQIAEADLKFRGPGQLLGSEQSGMPRFRFGNLTDDWDLIRRAKDVAADLIRDEAELA